MKINECVSWIYDDDSTGYLINTMTQKCLILDASGKMIWEQLLHNQDKEKVKEALTDKYPI